MRLSEYYKELTAQQSTENNSVVDLENIKLNCEGYSQQLDGQINRLTEFVKHEGVRTVLEIGFNAGHSSEIFLSGNPDCTVVSFDLGCQDIVEVGKRFIDMEYPGRHTLILGDSTVTVPKYISENPERTFDLIFIDGGHEYDVAIADIKNCHALSHPSTILIVDDVVLSHPLGEYWEGPTLAVIQASKDEIIGDMKVYEYNDYYLPRGMACGSYNHAASRRAHP